MGGAGQTSAPPVEERRETQGCASGSHHRDDWPDPHRFRSTRSLYRDPKEQGAM